MDSTVVVTGVGVASVVPDLVHVDLGVEVQADAPAAALGQVAAALRAVHAVLDDAGVVAADRATRSTSVHPHHDHSGRQRGVVAHAGLAVRVRDLERAGELVQRAAEAAGDLLRVHGLSVVATDTQEASARARAAAVLDARARAEQVAGAAGLLLGDVVSLVEGGPRGGAPDWMSLESGGARRTSAGPPVAPGEADVHVAVTGTWRLAPGS